MAILEFIRVTFADHIIFSVSIILLIGYIFGQLAERINLPAITGYLIAGVILGVSGLQLLPPENIRMLDILSQVTLSFIAVIIGAEFSIQKLKLYGKEILILTICQMLLTFILVSFGLLFAGLPNYTAFVLGAISAATAPAATVVIIEKLKVKGKFVDYLYGIVALDDAGTVILFSIGFAISTSMMGQAEFVLSRVLCKAFYEIFMAMVIGSIAGLLIHLVTRRKRNMNEVKILALGFIFLSTALSLSLNLSPLIANMVLGLVLINLSPKHARIVLSFEPFTNILYAIFFTVAGIELQLKVFSDIGVFFAGIVYIVMRMLGKYFGVFFGGAALKTDKNIRNYLGVGLFPQAGVAIGLVLFVQGSPLIEGISAEMHLEVVKMINIVLMSVFVNEILGPPLAKFAILRSMKRSE